MVDCTKHLVHQVASRGITNIILQVAHVEHTIVFWVLLDIEPDAALGGLDK